MEKFENMESDVFDMLNTPGVSDTSAIIRRNKYKAVSQNGQIMC